MAKHPRKPDESDDDAEPAKQDPKAERKKGSRAASLMHDNRMQRVVAKAPVAAAITHAQVHLPKVEAPSLEGIVVTVPAIKPPSPEDLTTRFHDVLRALADKKPRKAGEQVAAGDDVELDIVGYAHGKIIPFSLRQDVVMQAAPIPMLPGFGEKLVGLEVGKSATFDITLPENYPVEHLRGATASFLLDVNAAWKVTLPNPEDPATLRKLGRGNTLDEVMTALAGEIIAEREDQQLIEAQDRVLDEFAARVKVDLPDELIDEEIRRRWGEHEGKVAIKKDFSQEEMNDAVQGWLDDRATRIDVGRRLKVSLGLRALVEKEGLKVTAENIGPILEPVAHRVGIPVDDVKSALKKQATAGAQVIDTALHLLAVGFVVGKATITFEDA